MATSVIPVCQYMLCHIPKDCNLHSFRLLSIMANSGGRYLCEW